jgi:hypothetical protein
MDSMFQMRFGEDAYPISRFLVDRAQTLRLTRSDLARRLGYRNIGSAHKALAETLTTGKVPHHMWSHLAQALEIDQSILDAVIESTARQQQDEWRAWLLDRGKEHIADFRPHLRTETARTVPEPIFIAALIGTARFRLVELPSEVWDVSTADRNRLVKQAIQDHYQAHKGDVVPFGAILSYTLVTIPGYLIDFGYPFDTNGDPAGPMQEVKRLGEASLGVKRGDTRLSGLLRNTEIVISS